MANTRDESPSTAETLRAEMAPSGRLQHFLVDQIARSIDRLDLAAAREDREEPASLRAQVAAERSFYRAMSEYRRLVKAALRVDAPSVESSPSPPDDPSPTSRRIPEVEAWVDDLLSPRDDGEPRFRALPLPNPWLVEASGFPPGRNSEEHPAGRHRPRNPLQLAHSRPDR